MNIKLQRGVTLVELMVSLTIGLFLVGGLLTLLGAMKSTNTSQSGLSQLQDSERISLTIMTDVIQQGGFYVNPIVNTVAGSFPVSGVFTTAGQYIFGTGVGTLAAPGDTITVRYNTNGTALGDNTMNCLGGTSAVAATFINTFSVTGNNLQCTLTTIAGATITGPTATTIVTGINSLNIYYGVQTNLASGTTSADTYLDATAVTAGAYWTNVKSVQVNVSFVNPLAGEPGQTAAAKATIPLTRVIALMATTGVNT
jgi:type IV pilus assembly protein PilW